MNTMFADKIRIKDLEETLASSTALLAVVGAGDLAIEKIRAAREQIADRSASFDPKAFREQAQATLVEGVGALQTEMQSAPEQFRTLPERAQEWPAKAQAAFADLMATAFTTYGELAGRGKIVVGNVRGEYPDVEPVQPVSRPASSTATKPSARSTSSTTKRPASKSSGATTASKTTASKSTASKKTAAQKSTAQRSTAQRSTAQKSAARRTTAQKSAARKTSTGEPRSTSSTKKSSGTSSN